MDLVRPDFRHFRGNRRKIEVWYISRIPQLPGRNL